MLLFSHHHPSSNAYFLLIPDTIDAKFKLVENKMFQDFLIRLFFIRITQIYLSLYLFLGSQHFYVYNTSTSFEYSLINSKERCCIMIIGV